MNQEEGLCRRFRDYRLTHSLKLPRELKGPIFLDEGFINSELYQTLLKNNGTNYLRRFQLYSPFFLPNSGTQEYLPQSEAFSKASRVATCFISSIENLESLIEERSKGRNTIFPTIIFGSRAQYFYNLQKKQESSKLKINKKRTEKCGPRNIGYVEPNTGLRN